MKLQIIHGDSMEVLAELTDLRAVVSDPPYGLEFAGKEWDKLQPKHAPAGRRVGKSMEINPKSVPKMGRTPTGYGFPKKNPRCLVCGRIQYASERSKCQCEDPRWDTRGYEYAQEMQLWHQQWLGLVYEALQSGGVLRIFSGCRTYHRLAAAMAEVGFDEIDVHAWCYGSGFPKSASLSRTIDKQAGVEPIGEEPPSLGMANNPEWNTLKRRLIMPPPTTDGAKYFVGYGTALKPSWEAVVVGVRP